MKKFSLVWKNSGSTTVVQLSPGWVGLMVWWVHQAVFQVVLGITRATTRCIGEVPDSACIGWISRCYLYEEYTTTFEISSLTLWYNVYLIIFNLLYLNYWFMHADASINLRHRGIDLSNTLCYAVYFNVIWKTYFKVEVLCRTINNTSFRNKDFIL